jgi:hypothetical protein
MDNLLLAITSLPFFLGALTALGLIIQRHFTPSRGWPIWIGIGGRFGAESVADFKRNQWPIWRGIGGRFGAESPLFKGIIKISTAIPFEIYFITEISQPDDFRKLSANHRPRLLKRTIRSISYRKQAFSSRATFC